MRLRLLLLAMLALLAAGGCTPAARNPTAQGLPDRAQLLRGEALLAGAPQPAAVGADLLAVTAEMRDFVDRHVDRDASRQLRLQQLVRAVIGADSFGVRYSAATRTAAETFRARDGNCLSFTSLFVALAREAGLDAHFQQVEIPPDWERSGDTLVLNRHIDVLVELGAGEQQLVDFNIEDFRTGYERYKVSDRRAAAHYYNNLGVERLQGGDRGAALAALRAGVAADPRFSPLWTNLGTLYLRAGLLRHAEAAYGAALQEDAQDLVAISSLERVYRRLGDEPAAARCSELAQRHRDGNPWYRFHEAREAFLGHDYEGALQHLAFALRRKPREDAFHFLRGLALMQIGDTRRARAELRKAEAIADDPQAKRNYHSKLELLLSEQRT